MNANSRQSRKHLFCKVCGVQSFARASTPDGIRMVAANARCLDGVEPDQLKPNKFDGRRL